MSQGPTDFTEISEGALVKAEDAPQTIQRAARHQDAADTNPRIQAADAARQYQV